MQDSNILKIEQDLKKAIVDIKKTSELLTDIRYSRDIDFTESIRRRTLNDIIRAGVLDNTLTDINTTTNLGLAGSVSHASIYDRRLKVIIDGAEYYIGLYLV